MDVEIIRRQTAAPYALIRDVTCDNPPHRLLEAAQGEQTPNAKQNPPEDGDVRMKQLEPLIEVDPPGQIARLSISHDGEYVTAVCLAAESPDPSDV
jgi:holo-[acyl-carrier protein] synthase